MTKPIEIYKVKSRTRVGKIHLVNRFEDGRLECTCEDFVLNHNFCKHAKDITKQLQDKNNG